VIPGHTNPLPPALSEVQPGLSFSLSAGQHLEDIFTDPFQSTSNFQESFQALLRTLTARDPATRHHCHRVTQQACRFARFLGLPEKDLKILGTANLLHDIGKIGISDAILFKPSRLTAEERLIIETHTLIGEKLVEHLELHPEETNIILFHHERWDGKGYPQGLGEEEIPLLSRISALADVFDALTSHRPYRSPFPVRKALGEIQLQAGKQFDPHLAQQFIHMVTSCPHNASHPSAPHPAHLRKSRIRARDTSSPMLSR